MGEESLVIVTIGGALSAVSCVVLPTVSSELRKDGLGGGGIEIFGTDLTNLTLDMVWVASVGCETDCDTRARLFAAAVPPKDPFFTGVSGILGFSPPNESLAASKFTPKLVGHPLLSVGTTNGVSTNAVFLVPSLAYELARLRKVGRVGCGACNDG